MLDKQCCGGVIVCWKSVNEWKRVYQNRRRKRKKGREIGQNKITNKNNNIGKEIEGKMGGGHR